MKEGRKVVWVCFACGDPAAATEPAYEGGEPTTTTVRPCGCSGPAGTMAGPPVPTIETVRKET